jgi:hypothetical protein
LEAAVTVLAALICLAVAGLAMVRDCGGVPAAPSQWRTPVAVAEGALWMAVATVAAPQLWGLLT